MKGNNVALKVVQDFRDDLGRVDTIQKDLADLLIQVVSPIDAVMLKHVSDPLKVQLDSNRVQDRFGTDQRC